MASPALVITDSLGRTQNSFRPGRLTLTHDNKTSRQTMTTTNPAERQMLKDKCVVSIHVVSNYIDRGPKNTERLSVKEIIENFSKISKLINDAKCL